MGAPRPGELLTVRCERLGPLPLVIALVNRLAPHALGQAIYDLTPPSRRLLVEIGEWLAGRAREAGQETRDVRFGQRELRDRVGWKKSQLAHHLKELLEAEYLVKHVSGPGRTTRYTLDWDGRGFDGERFYRSLIDVEALARKADMAKATDSGSSGSVPGHFRSSSGNRKTRPIGRKDAITGESASNVRTSGEERP